MLKFEKFRVWLPDAHGSLPIEFEDLKVGDLFCMESAPGKSWRVLSLPVACQPDGNFSINAEPVT